MAERTFSIAYDGPALEAGRMAVRDLAPALLALGDIFTDASVLLYPDREPIALNIKATEPGSFLVRLILESEEAWDRLVDIFGTEGVAALANLEAIVAGAAGLFWFLKRMKGRRIAKQEPVPGAIRMTLDDGTTLEVQAEVLTLYHNVEIRKKTKQVVAPLTREGIDRVKFIEESTELVVIDKADVPAYELPEGAEEVLLDEVREMVVEIASVAFMEGNKWRLTDGQLTFFAMIEDSAFLERVEAGLESFRKGDMLRCRMRIIQTQREIDGLHSEYVVVEVIDHIPRQTQMSFDG